MIFITARALPLLCTMRRSRALRELRRVIRRIVPIYETVENVSEIAINQI